MSREWPVIGLKLITGEDIVCHARYNNIASSWEITNPGLLVGMTNSAGAPSVGMTDYIPFTANKNIRIAASNILFTYEPDNEMITGYNAKLETDELPTNENIVPFTRK